MYSYLQFGDQVIYLFVKRYTWLIVTNNYASLPTMVYDIFYALFELLEFLPSISHLCAHNINATRAGNNPIRGYLLILMIMM